MLIEYLGAKEINGSLIVIDNIDDVAYEEMCVTAEGAPGPCSLEVSSAWSQ